MNETQKVIASRLPVYDPRARTATPKHEMVPAAIRKQEKKKLKSQMEDEFRSGVWARDKSRSRASGKPLVKSGADYDRVGEVHHRLARSTNPDRIYDVTIGVLLSKSEHRLAETACPGDPGHCLLDIEGAEDMALQHTFIWRDRDGKELKRRTS